MSNPPSNITAEAEAPAKGQFMMTRWSLIAKISDPSNPAYQSAMAEFYQAYWYPLYAFARRAGKSKEDSEDIVSNLVVKLLTKNWLSRANADKGRLRTFLLTCLKRLMNDEYKASRAAKRDVGLTQSLDEMRFDVGWAEGRYAKEPVDEMTPDRLYQRRWALTVLENSLKELEAEESNKKRKDRFLALRGYLGFSSSVVEDNYAATAEKLGIPLGTIKAEVSRLRSRWNALLKNQVALTLDSDDEAEITAELGELLTLI